MTNSIGTPVLSLRRCDPLLPGRKAVSLRSISTLLLFLGTSAAYAQPAKPAAPAAGPHEETITLDEFVIVGVRASLAGAQEIKQNSVQLVDSIVAEDIGKLPDNTVAEALQRVPGIQVSRDNGEVSSVVIRGLPNLGTTLNGHEVFTGVNRGVSLQDIPAEMLAGVDVYKSTSPEHIEGGIAGLIDVRLRRPFDFKGFEAAAGGRLIYSDRAKKYSEVGSLMVSNRYKLSNDGEFGALIGVSYQRYLFTDQRLFNFLWDNHPSAVTPGQPTIVYPLTTGSIINPGNRRRPALTISLQWKPTSELEIYSDFLYTGYRNRFQNYFFIGIPLAGALQSAVLQPGTNVVRSLVSNNNFTLTSTQAFENKTDGYQEAIGLKWRHDQVTLSTEFVYDWNSFKGHDTIVDTWFNAPVFSVDFNQNGGANVKSTGTDTTDPKNFNITTLFDDRTYQTSNQGAWRADLDYAFRDSVWTHLKVGTRISRRAVDSRATSNGNFHPPGGDVQASTVPGFGTVTPTGLVSSSDFGVTRWFLANPDYLLDNVGKVRTLFGRPVTTPNFDPLKSFSDVETTAAVYAQGAYLIDLGGKPLEGTIGVRAVNTNQSLGAYQASGATFLAVQGGKNQMDVLPSLNGRYKMQDNLQVRYAATRTVTRPNFGDLNPAVTLVAPNNTNLGSGGGGNPNLRNVKSDNYDLALEYYFAKASYFAVTGFYRKIDGYVQVFNQNENIGGIDYNVSRPRNSGSGHLQGIETSYQHFFDFLPAAFKGFGAQANFTYIDGKTDDPVAHMQQALAQVSKYNYNLVAIYEHGPYSARLAYNWRGKYIDSFNSAGAQPVIYVKPTTRLDFSASCELRKGLTVTLDITNILNSKYQDYFGTPMYARDTRFQDRTYAVGLRYRY